MGLCFGCFGGGNTKQMTKEEERLASEEAKARAEQKRILQCDHSTTEKQNQEPDPDHTPTDGGEENQSSNPDKDAADELT